MAWRKKWQSSGEVTMIEADQSWHVSINNSGMAPGNGQHGVSKASASIMKHQQQESEAKVAGSVIKAAAAKGEASAAAKRHVAYVYIGAYGRRKVS